MAEERGASREYPAWRPKPAAWTKLFGTFLVALDPFKLLAAAAGILATALGWWLISLVFYSAWTLPKESEYDTKFTDKPEGAERTALQMGAYQKDLATWAMIHELAGPSDRSNPDYAKYYQAKYPTTERQRDGVAINRRAAEGFGGKYRTMPWAENRGPNPFLMSKTLVTGTGEDRKEVLTWFGSNQVPNLVEPLVKFMTPVFYLFDGRATFWVYVYLLLLVFWLLVVWAFFGGIITRMAVLQVSGKEGGGLREAVRFVKSRYLAYLLSPVIPILVIGFLVFCCMLFGVIHWIPVLGDLADGLLWWLPLLAGLVMTLMLVGMVGYPLMYSTLSAEGSDTFDALSRSYNYVFESPWHYIWYSAVAIVYGAVLTLFVVTVGSATVYLAKWGVAKFPAWGADRSPEYLFVYAPESLGWRQVLVEGSAAAIDPTKNGEAKDPAARDAYMNNYAWYNHVGAGMTSFWVTIVFMMVIGFSYSYFWTASTQVYLLMRQRVDETELDEVYIEEEAPDAPPMMSDPLPAPVPTPTAPMSVAVDPPTIKPSMPALEPSPSPAPAPLPAPTPMTPPDAPGPSGG